eukprot:sb/3471543/
MSSLIQTARLMHRNCASFLSGEPFRCPIYRKLELMHGPADPVRLQRGKELFGGARPRQCAQMGSAAPDRTGPIRSARATTGKAGAQWKSLGAEAEGPSAAATASLDIKNGNFGAFSEASVGRAEVKGPLGVRARLDPNLDTGIGLQSGQLKAKLFGFGFSVGGGGIGISTPLGGLGLGNSGK